MNLVTTLKLKTSPKFRKFLIKCGTQSEMSIAKALYTLKSKARF